MNDATHLPGAARRRRVGAVALALCALVLVSACGGPFPQSAMDNPASDMAVRLQDLFEGILWWAIGVFVIVEGALLIGIFKYRDRRVGPADGAPAEPRYVHGNTLLELAWTLAPAIVLVFIAVPTMTTIWDVDRLTSDPDALQIEVIGHQWWWEFRYPDYDLVTANEAYIPEGRTVEFLLTSADVIHSFWVPRLAGKRDVMPGHETHLWFTADSVGRFTGQCAEFCGLSHALMKLEVVVATPDDFAAWVEAQTQPSPVLQMAAASDTIDAAETEAELARQVAEAEEARADSIEEGADSVPGVDRTAEPEAQAEPDTQDEAAAPAAQDADLATILEEGQQLLMTRGCIACHRIQGTPAAGVLGPDLSHVGSRRTIAAGILENTTENMIRWLRDPGEVKPGALMPALQLSEGELRTLAAYLRNLE